MTIKKAVKRLQGWLDEGYYKINRQDSDWSEDKAALELAIQCMNDTRPKGEWKFNEHGSFYCSVCNGEPYDQYATTAFCPFCGADMRKGVTE